MGSEENQRTARCKPGITASPASTLMVLELFAEVVKMTECSKIHDFKFIITPKAAQIEISWCRCKRLQYVKNSMQDTGVGTLKIYWQVIYIWDMMLHVKSYRLSWPGKNQRAQGDDVDPTGLHCTYVNMEACKVMVETARSTACLPFKAYSRLLQIHVQATQHNMQQRDRAYTFPLRSLLKASGQRSNLLHACSCPFIYSTLINVENQFGTADTISATVH